MNQQMDARQIIGRTRARFRMHWPWYVWAIPIAIPMVIGIFGIVDGHLVAAVVAASIAFLLATVPLLLFFRAFRIHVTDRAIVSGVFIPGTMKEVHLYSDIDPTTIRAWSNVSAYLRATGMSPDVTGRRVNRGAKHGISYRVRRAGMLEGRTLTENETVTTQDGTVVVMSVAGPSEPLVRAIAGAMQEAGAAQADQVLGQALPPGRLSSEPGSHVQQIPGWPRTDSTGFGDVPAEMQERMRRQQRRR